MPGIVFQVENTQKRKWVIKRMSTQLPELVLDAPPLFFKHSYPVVPHESVAPWVMLHECCVNTRPPDSTARPSPEEIALHGLEAVDNDQLRTPL